MDVSGWLRGLGLGQYEEKFRDNKIAVRRNSIFSPGAGIAPVRARVNSR
jgi:hypothetical protein